MTTLNTTVSHMTGTTTRIGWELSSTDVMNWDQIQSDVQTVLGFICGVVTAGLVVGTKGRFNLTWRYAVVAFAESILLFVCGAQALSWTQPAHALKTLLSVAMGLQNGATSLWSGGVGRSTHVTGFVADIGLLTAHIILSFADADWFRFRLFVPMYLSFFIGSLIGGYVHRSSYASALYLPATIALCYGVGTLIWCWRSAREQQTKSVMDGLARSNAPTPDDTAAPQSTAVNVAVSVELTARTDASGGGGSGGAARLVTSDLPPSNSDRLISPTATANEPVTASNFV